jgi:hypothetical protein
MLVTVAAAVVLAMLLVQARGDRDDAEAALAAKQAEIDEARSMLEAEEARSADLQSQLSSAQAELSRAEEQLAGAEDELAASNEELDGMLVDVIDFLAMSVAVAGMDQPDADCVAETMVAERGGAVLRDFADAAGGGLSNSGLFSVGLLVLQAAEDCGIPLDSIGALGQSGFEYGDDVELDALQDRCTDGFGGACDDLYFQSPAGSEYERFGATCGDRFSLDDAPFLCDGAIE